MSDKQFKTLKILNVMFVVYIVLIPATLVTSTCWSNSSELIFKTIGICLLVVSYVFCFVRTSLILGLGEESLTKKAYQERTYNLVFIVLMAIWFIFVNVSFLANYFIGFAQENVVPFLFLMYAFCFYFTRRNHKIVYCYYRRGVEERDPYAKITNKGFYWTKLGRVDKARQFNNSILAEIYFIIVAMFLAGFTPYGLVFGLSYLGYYFINNFRRIMSAVIDTRTKVIFLIIDNIVMIAIIVLASLCMTEPFFNVVINIGYMKESDVYFKIIPVLVSLILTIWVAIFRHKIDEYLY